MKISVLSIARSGGVVYPHARADIGGNNRR